MTRRPKRPSVPFGGWKDPERYRQCVWPLCPDEASSRYEIVLCQRHILYIWSVVERDLRESSYTVDDYEQAVEESRRQSELPAPGFAGMIYYLNIGPYIKIGHTKDLHRRLRAYPPQTQVLASHPGSREDEQELHRQFAAFRESGREWYMDVPEIREHIAALPVNDTYARKSQKRTRSDAPPTHLRPRTSKNMKRVV
jgi:T5orf172 domain